MMPHTICAQKVGCESFLKYWDGMCRIFCFIQRTFIFDVYTKWQYDTKRVYKYVATTKIGHLYINQCRTNLFISLPGNSHSAHISICWKYFITEKPAFKDNPKAQVILWEQELGAWNWIFDGYGSPLLNCRLFTLYVDSF